MSEKVSEEVERMEQQARDLGYDPHWMSAYGHDHFGQPGELHRAWFYDAERGERQVVAEGFSARSLEEAYRRALAQAGVVG
jgi:hypothetical protein